jgi:hypothetical protein
MVMDANMQACMFAYACVFEQTQISTRCLFNYAGITKLLTTYNFHLI